MLFTFIHRFCKLFAALSVLIFGAFGAQASEPPLLTVHVYDAEPVTFTREELRDLDWREITTHTPFTEGPQTFAGPSLASLLDMLNARAGWVTAQAVNFYAAEFEVSTAFERDALLAMEHNGEVMRLRDKGPIWVIFPQSEKEAAEKLFVVEMVWQLDTIFVE